jgi:hypothetical protein
MKLISLLEVSLKAEAETSARCFCVYVYCVSVVLRFDLFHIQTFLENYERDLVSQELIK